MTKIADSKGRIKKLWRTLTGIIGEKTAKAEDNSHTVNDFANFFADKVEVVRLSTSSVPLQDIPYTATHMLDSFSMLTIEQVEKMIGAAQGKTCQLDPASTWIVKEFSTLLSPFIVRLFNESFATGCFPERYKYAIITPLLKKSNMDTSQRKSYRPVSNLPFLSKLLERAVHSKLQAFLNANSAMPAHQSSYRMHHSTETALIKAYDNLLKATDNGQMSSLCLSCMTWPFLSYLF